MEFKISRETIPTTEVLYSGVQEQGVELDYILPDYYPDIFRLVRCELTPVVTGYSIVSDKLTYELRCGIRILYCSENGTLLQSVEQSQSFTKSVDIGRAGTSPEVTITPKTDHVNFRAVNKRRLDMRGAVSVRICVCGETSQEVISDAAGMNIQLRKKPVEYAAKRLSAEKALHISEETELSPAQPDIINIVNVRAVTESCEQKMISGKILAKGEMNVNVLYSCDSPEGGAVESMDFTLTYSQIVDMEGVDDTFECSVVPSVVNCDVTAAADKDGDTRILHCEAEIRLVCKAVKTSVVMLVTDAFSTVYPCVNTCSDISTELSPSHIHESFRHTAVLSDKENAPQTIYSMWCTPKNINSHMDEDGKTLMISGMLTYSMACRDSSGAIVIPDKDEAFEQRIPIDIDKDKSTVRADITVNEVTYNITAEGGLSAVAEISADIVVSSSSSINVVTDISIDDTTRKKRDGDYAIKLYFGVENEDVWDIAKRYSTDVGAVIEENDIDGEKLDNSGMILIPIVS